jgi:hypothetical protein
MPEPKAEWNRETPQFAELYPEFSRFDLSNVLTHHYGTMDGLGRSFYYTDYYLTGENLRQALADIALLETHLPFVRTRDPELPVLAAVSLRTAIDPDEYPLERPSQYDTSYLRFRMHGPSLKTGEPAEHAMRVHVTKHTVDRDEVAIAQVDYLADGRIGRANLSYWKDDVGHLIEFQAEEGELAVRSIELVAGGATKTLYSSDGGEQ